MKTGLRVLVRLLPAPRFAPARRAARSSRKSARAALASGLAWFVLASAALAVVVEGPHRERRDPEFGYRLAAVSARKAEEPGRPLVLALGSSRIQQGLDPGAMNLGNGPGDPMVFNFGYRGAAPVVAVRNFFRLVEAGVRPDFVLIEFTPASATGRTTGARVVQNWPNRFTITDVLWLGERGFLERGEASTASALSRWLASSAMPWTSHRQVIVPHWLPEWVPETQWKMLGRERMDRHGFTEMQVESTTTQLFQRDPEGFRNRFARFDQKEMAAVVSKSVKQAYRLLIDHCQAEGIPVAVVWVPLSPLIRSWVDPELQDSSEAFARELTRDRAVPVFPPPDWLVDDDFADGQHLLPPAAARYSRWLADTHLKPWLARHQR